MGVVSKASLLLYCITYAFALPDGAPSGVCSTQSSTFTPRHFDMANGGFISTQSASTLPYSIMMNRMNVSACGLVQVWVMDSRTDNAGYRGLLIQARNKMSLESGSLGTWESSPVNTKMLTCTRENDSMTHSEVMNIKGPSTIFTWKAPSSLQNIEEIVFVATIAQSREMFWTNVMSPSLLRSDSTSSVPCGVAPVTSNTMILIAHAALAGIAAKVLLH